MLFIAGATVARDATGNVNDTLNGSYAFLDCSHGKNDYQTRNSVSSKYNLIYGK